MKVITTATVRVGQAPDSKVSADQKKPVYLPPGEHDLDEAVAKDLRAKGYAITPAAKAARDASAKDADKRP